MSSSEPKQNEVTIEETNTGYVVKMFGVNYYVYSTEELEELLRSQLEPKFKGDIHES